MIRLALLVALSTGCMASYAISSRHDQPRLATPKWRVAVDLSLVAASGVAFALLPEGRTPWIPYGFALGVFAVDSTALVATGSKD